MEDNLKDSETKSDEEPKPKRKKKLIIPWKALALYVLPALVVFIIFFVMHKSFVQAPLSREEIAALLVNNQEEELSDNKSEEKQVEDYLEWSKLNIRPRMLEIESVIEFKDYYITNSQDSGYDYVEVIKISNINDFENDNKKTIGLKIANDWLEWVDNYKIIYCDNF